jgi:DNA-binding SARP family transcriptional activator/tetratricopeptide (TPR) repeat protein/DNA-binding XRE family transcriptional regulator
MSPIDGNHWAAGGCARESADGAFGALVRDRRRAAGLTQQQLAVAAGVSVGAVRDLEQDRTARPHPQTAERLRATLGLGPDEAVDRTGRSAETGDPPAGDARGPHGTVRVCVLGPLAAWRGGARAELGPARQRAVLGLLAVRPGVALHRDAIVEALWDGNPPDSAIKMVQGYVGRLRQQLDAGRSAGDRDGVLVSAGTRYQLHAGAGQFDVIAFHQATGRAQAARRRGDAAAACEMYGQALSLWRGMPLADLDLLSGHPAVTGLARRRAEVVTDFAETAIGAGLPDRVLPHLQALADSDPLDERAHAWLMLALAGTGQQAAALAVYERSRRRLDEELGIGPGAELMRAHELVLRQEVPAAGSGQNLTVTSVHPVVHQLPGDVHAFTGRTSELAGLDHMLAAADPAETSAPVIFAVSGTAGAGKTALAVHWARRLMDRFPDGQLFVDLRGYDPELAPVPPGEALAGFLRALGLGEQEIPGDVGERAAAFRSMAAGRQMLIILDNASSAEQVHGLLPGSPSCVAVVTSRDRLAGIVARHGAIPIEIDVLPAADAVALLRVLVGERVDAEPDAAMTLAVQCARLPLALRVAAELAVASPAVPLRALAHELDDEQRRLEILDAGGDPRTMVRSVFSWSFRHLSAAAAGSFRLLGLHPGPDFDLYAATALTGNALDRARSTLDMLVTAHLVRRTSGDRYAMHDLLRAYALSLPAEPGEQRSAMTRLLDYYLATAASAMEALAPADRNRRPLAPVVVSCPPVSDPARARAWLDQERAVLVAAIRHATLHGWPDHAIRLAATLSRYLVTGGHNTEAISIYEHALDAARRSGDRGAEATALVNLTEVRWRLGLHGPDDESSGQALAVFREIGDRVGEARAHGNLALLCWRHGRYAEASRHYELALAVFCEIGDRAGEARALDNLGAICCRQGRYEQAASQHGRALAIFREIVDLTGQTRALTNLGCARKGQELWEQATRHLEDSLTLSRKNGDRASEAEALSGLGAVQLGDGRPQQAADHYRRALMLFRELGHQGSEAEALNGSGGVLLAMGQPEQARARHALALDLATQIGDTYQQAGAHHGLAGAYAADANYRTARHHWQHALDLYTRLDVPEARRVLGHLRRVRAGIGGAAS